MKYLNHVQDSEKFQLPAKYFNTLINIEKKYC